MGETRSPYVGQLAADLLPVVDHINVVLDMFQSICHPRSVSRSAGT